MGKRWYPEDSDPQSYTSGNRPGNQYNEQNSKSREVNARGAFSGRDPDSCIVAIGMLGGTATILGLAGYVAADKLTAQPEPNNPVVRKIDENQNTNQPKRVTNLPKNSTLLNPANFKLDFSPNRDNSITITR